MSEFDWRAAVKAIAPTIAGVAGGPLAGGAMEVLADALLGESTGDPVQDEAKVAGLLSAGITPELRAKVLEADAALKLALVEAGVREKEIAARNEQAYLADIDSARRAHAQTQGVLWLGYVINVASYACVGGVLWGCFRLLGTNGGITVDPGTAAMLGGIVGAAVQWLLANAAQANSFFFGSSPGSRQLSSNVGAAVSNAVSATGKRG